MAKFKTDGFKIAKDFMSKNVYTDVRVYKQRSRIEVIAVKDGMIVTGQLRHSASYRSAFNLFKSQDEVDTAIDKFIAEYK